MKYKITKDSVKVHGEGVEMMVIFIRDDGTSSKEQRYEVPSLDEKEVYKALDSAARGFEALGVEKIAPDLDEDVELEVAQKINELTPKAEPLEE